MCDVQKYCRGQIFWRADSTELRPGVIGKNRPVLIMSNNTQLQSNMSPVVIPLTTNTDRIDGIVHIPIKCDNRDSVILCDQITTISMSELDGYIGTISSDKMAEVEQGVQIVLGMQSMPDISSQSIDIEDSDYMLYNDDSEDSKKRRKWSFEDKLSFISDCEDAKNGKITKESFLDKWNYSSMTSALSCASRFKRSLNTDTL